MKIAIVYYSLLGNTEYVANKLAEGLDSDVVKLETVKDYPKSKTKLIFIGGMKSAFKSKPKLKEYHFDPEKYDQIIIGTPTWASNLAPAIRTFLKENKDSFKDKNISVFVSSSGGNAEKVFESFKKTLGTDLKAELSIADPKFKQSEDKDKQIDEFITKIKE